MKDPDQLQLQTELQLLLLGNTILGSPAKKIGGILKK